MMLNRMFAAQRANDNTAGISMNKILMEHFQNLVKTIQALRGLCSPLLFGTEVEKCSKKCSFVFAATSCNNLCWLMLLSEDTGHLIPFLKVQLFSFISLYCI